MAKNLVVYFSHAGENYFGGALQVIKKGNTEVIADKIQAMLGCEKFKIETEKEYPIGYHDCCDAALAEQKAGELPKLKSDLTSIDEFDNIILCSPCWWGTMPQAVFSFLNQHNFAGKTIYPLCTHEGSGMGRSEADLKAVCSDANVEVGLAIQGSTVMSADDKLKKWLKNLI